MNPTHEIATQGSFKRGAHGQLYGNHTKSGLFYVYKHVNPKTSEIFYVGLGKFNRCNQIVQRNQFWHNYFKKHGFLVEIIAQGLTREKAADLEKKLIKTFKPRCNLTHGGEQGCLTGKAVHAFTDEGVLYRSFETISDANAFFGVLPNDSRIARCLNGKRQRFKGFMWAESASAVVRFRPRKEMKAIEVHRYDLKGDWVASYSRPRLADVPYCTGIYNALDSPRTYAASFWRSVRVDRISCAIPKPAKVEAKKVVCAKTGHIYESLTEAAKAHAIPHQTLSKKLRGTIRNNTNLQFYAEGQTCYSQNN